MPAILAPPKSLSHLPYVVVRYDRELGVYELIEPNRAHTYILGNAFQSRQYLERTLGEYLGGRALDSALAFGASQALIGKNRAFGLDLCKVDLNAGIIRKDDDDGMLASRLLGDDPDSDMPVC